MRMLCNMVAAKVAVDSNYCFVHNFNARMPLKGTRKPHQCSAHHAVVDGRLHGHSFGQHRPHLGRRALIHWVYQHQVQRLGIGHLYDVQGLQTPAASLQKVAAPMSGTGPCFCRSSPQGFRILQPASECLTALSVRVLLLAAGMQLLLLVVHLSCATQQSMRWSSIRHLHPSAAGLDAAMATLKASSNLTKAFRCHASKLGLQEPT